MEYRKLDKSGIETSLLGFGCMRFPTTAEGKIDFAEAEKMLDKAYAAGVNYFDTAYPYHNGESELVVGEVMKKYDRSSFYIATKLPMWKVHSVADAEETFNEQLQKLQTDYVDFYLLHALNKEKWEEAKANGVVEYCAKLKEEGKIKNYGFSFHDDYEVFEDILNYRDWDFCQIQYNYLDTEEQAGDKGYELTVQKNVPLVIMEPVKGGSLANFSEDINDRFHALNPDASIASFALRWVGSHENVKVVLSGMSTMEQVDDNLATFGEFKPLSEAEEQEIKAIVAELRARVQNGCTGCRYCMPCPAGVNIPENFKIWNTYHMFRQYDRVKNSWENNLKDEEKAKNCIKCGKCEAMCPQKLSIRDNLMQVQKDLDGKIF